MHDSNITVTTDCLLLTSLAPEIIAQHDEQSCLIDLLAKQLDNAQCTLQDLGVLLFMSAVYALVACSLCTHNVAGVCIQLTKAVYEKVCLPTGVKLKNKQSITADLVVNATGRSSQMTEWLQQAGHNPPPTMTVDAGLRYTSRMYEIPDDPDRAWTTAIIGSRPALTKQSTVTSIEGNKWQARLLRCIYTIPLPSPLPAPKNLNPFSGPDRHCSIQGLA